MRIAMVGPFGLHPKQTMRSRALQLAKPLAQRGHDICLFMPPWHTPEEADKTWSEDGVQLRYIPLARSIPSIAVQLTKEVLAWQPNAVHGFKPKAYSGLVMWYLWHFRRKGLRLLVDTDDWEGWGGWNERENYTAVQKRFFAWQEKWGLIHCHTLTVASRALETIALSLGVKPAQVLYLPNGPGVSVIGNPYSVNSEPDLHALSPHPPTILVYSRLFEFDVTRLVKILCHVKTAVPDLHILFVGAGLFADENSQFKQQLAAAGLLEHVTDAGWVKPENLPEVLVQADAGIYLMEDSLLNRTKCPVKLADMLGLGIPVVAEAVGQVPEYVVHGRCGLLRASGDNDGLIQDLIFLLQNSAERQRMAEAAQQHIKTHFSWDNLAANLETAYKKAAK